MIQPLSLIASASYTYQPAVWVASSRKSFKSVINELLKRALREAKKPAVDLPFFMAPHYSGGLIDGLEWSDLKKIDQEQESEHMVQKLREGR